MTFFEPKKARSRRNEIRDEVRRQRPASATRSFGSALRDEKTLLALAVAIAFTIAAASVLMLRPRVVELRPGQVTDGPVISRVGFTVHNEQRLQEAKDVAVEQEPSVYRPSDVDPIDKLHDDLLALPQEVRGLRADQLDTFKTPLGGPTGILDGASLAKLQAIAAEMDPQWPQAVERFTERLNELNLVLLPAERAQAEGSKPVRLPDGRLAGPGERLVPPVQLAESDQQSMRRELARKLTGPAEDAFSPMLSPKIVGFALSTLGPTHVLDEPATTRAREAAAERVPSDRGVVAYRANQILLPAGHRVSEADWELLRAENIAHRDSLGSAVWLERAGLLGCVAILTIALALYAVKFQPRVARNPVRAASLALLLLASLLVAQLAGLGTGSLALLGIGPVLLTAMTVSVAYDGRFATGVGGILALLVTIGLGEGVGFYLVNFAGLLTCCFLLNEVRTRSKLIEVGGLTGMVVGIAAIVVGLARMDSFSYVLTQAAWAALAGFAAGGLVLCALPFIERTFRITTGLTLLEYQDHPLLRRLALEAPGTYNHSLQVANLSEEAANAIGANSLLCRVACYYHDIGKLRKPEYFIENQQSLDPNAGDGSPALNPHLTLNPSMSLLVIIGHVKDGVAMAREWGLPRAFLPFIEQHHGTTLVEYFYREACQRQKQKQAEGHPAAEPEPADCDYRYPGPRPRTRETAIVMLADCCESACRAMQEPTPTRIEARVNDLLQKRLLDRQFDECPITMGELELVRKSLVKSLVGVYHGRVPYPSDESKPTTVIPQATAITTQTAAG